MESYVIPAGTQVWGINETPDGVMLVSPTHTTHFTVYYNNADLIHFGSVWYKTAEKLLHWSTNRLGPFGLFRLPPNKHKFEAILIFAEDVENDQLNKERNEHP